MANETKKYCEGIDCAWCNEKEPCIYKIANGLEEKLLHKEQECEELKEQCKKYGEINEQETKDYAELWKQHDKLKQTLQDVKEIAEKHAPRCAVSCPNDDYKCEICMLDDLKQILQKISEVE